MVQRISFGDLVTKIQSGKITGKEAESYFTIDTENSRPFDPAIVINENAVDLTGVEAAGRAAAHELGIRASKVADQNFFARRKGAPPPDGTIIAEGDSWFHLPSWYQKTMLYWLKANYPITDIAHQGDTLSAIMSAGEYLPYLATGKVRILMFSAGGNDFLGDALESCLNIFDPHHTQPGDADYYLTKQFERILRECDTLYRLLSSNVLASQSKQGQIIVHGYDLANPWCRGNFIGDRMASRGLSPCSHPALCEAIIHRMIERFNAVLLNLSRILPNFTYAKLLNTLGRGDFLEELHPKSAKAQLLANKMRPYLDAVPSPASNRRPRKHR